MLRYDQFLENKGVSIRRNDRVHKSVSLNQLILYAHFSGVSIVQNIQPRLLERLKRPKMEFILKEDTDLIKMAMLILSYNNSIDSRPVINDCLLSIKEWVWLFPEGAAMDTLILLLSDLVDFPKEDIQKIGVTIFAPIIVSTYDFEKILDVKREMKVIYDFELTDLFEEINDYEWGKFFNEVLNSDISNIIENLDARSYNSSVIDMFIRKILDFQQIVREWGFETYPKVERLREVEDNINDIDIYIRENPNYMNE